MVPPWCRQTNHAISMTVDYPSFMDLHANCLRCKWCLGSDSWCGSDIPTHMRAGTCTVLSFTEDCTCPTLCSYMDILWHTYKCTLVWELNVEITDLWSMLMYIMSDVCSSNKESMAPCLTLLSDGK